MLFTYTVRKVFFIVFLIPLFVCCSGVYVSAKRVSIDKSVLASTFVGSPDKRQVEAESGEKIHVVWRLPSALYNDKALAALHIVYKDLTEEVIYRPLNSRIGSFSFFVDGKTRSGENGILSYKVDIEDGEGRLIGSWHQHMWVSVYQL